jgi:hypothetical protein
MVYRARVITSSAAALLGPHPGEAAVSDAREESSV